MENRCICCGEIIPEGRQVCPSCEAKTDRERCGIVFSKHLINLRKEAGMTRKQLAQEADVPLQTLAFYESGNTLPTLEPLLHLAYFFGVPLDELCGMEEYIKVRDEE